LVCQARSGSPLPGSSILITSAPKSASCEETALPATSRDMSTTRMPSSGQAASGSKDLCGMFIATPGGKAAQPPYRGPETKQSAA